jgi:hypothetical protein
MISTFVSQEFELGLKLTQPQLQEVNEARQATKHIDEHAAKEMREKIYKNPLSNSPFVLEFKYGARAGSNSCCDILLSSTNNGSSILIAAGHPELVVF